MNDDIIRKAYEEGLRKGYSQGFKEALKKIRDFLTKTEKENE